MGFRGNDYDKKALVSVLNCVKAKASNQQHSSTDPDLRKAEGWTASRIFSPKIA